MLQSNSILTEALRMAGATAFWAATLSLAALFLPALVLWEKLAAAPAPVSCERRGPALTQLGSATSSGLHHRTSADPI